MIHEYVHFDKGYKPDGRLSCPAFRLADLTLTTLAKRCTKGFDLNHHP